MGDPGRAKALAAGNLRGGKVVLYAPDTPLAIGCAQCVSEHLAEIGLEVEIRPIAEWTTASAYRGRLGNPDEPWDMALVLWTPDFVDPYGYINRLLDTQDAGGTNLARFDEPEYIEQMQARGEPAGRRPQQGLRRARPPARTRCRADRSVPRPQRGDTRLGARRLHAAAPEPRADDRLPETLRLLHRHPDEPVRDGDPGR